MKKRVLAILVVICLLVPLAACGGGGDTTPPAQPTPPAGGGTPTPPADDNGEEGFAGRIYIGITAGITGVAPLEGEAMTQSVTLAAELINAAGGVLGKELVPIIEDDAYTNEGGITVATRFIADDRIVAMAGPGRSGVFMAISEMLYRARMPIVTPATSPAFYGLGYDNWFRVRSSDSSIARFVPTFLVDTIGATNIGVMHTNDDAGIGAAAIFIEELENMGVPFTVVAYTGGEIDYTGHVMSIRDAGIDGLILWGHTVDLAVITRNMDQIGFDVPIVGNTGFMSATFLDMVEDHVADGIYIVTDANLQSDDPFVQFFLEEFRNRFPGIEPDIVNAIHFSYMFVLADAIERAGVAEREAIIQALHETRDVPSVLGPLTTDRNQNMAHMITILQNQGKVAHPMYTFHLEPIR